MLDNADHQRDSGRATEEQDLDGGLPDADAEITAGLAFVADGSVAALASRWIWWR